MSNPLLTYVICRENNKPIVTNKKNIVLVRSTKEVFLVYSSSERESEVKTRLSGSKKNTAVSNNIGGICSRKIKEWGELATRGPERVPGRDQG